jgi:hypothetical protein
LIDLGAQIRLSEGRYANAENSMKCFAEEISRTCAQYITKNDVECSIFVTSDDNFENEFILFNKILSSNLKTIKYQVYRTPKPPVHLDHDRTYE